ncbi:ead/Ea22-like family protein [Pseudomonas aeruginosa]|uniref:ead/Ea22-like family protein n=1 Tax=Pseudomonas aeruginosa TaxID=287 RepID=UPI001E392D7C|nr:ead/Ea22-like family protein [Pseudomonas aeruginosa]MCD2752672.1 ead/Ea22-like family protein [Pseudomonas aeruginosa]
MTDHAELRRVAALAHPDAEWFIARNLDHPNIDKPAASFIATAAPKTVLALLDEIDRLKAENEELRGALEQLAEMLNSIHIPIDLNEILKGTTK